MRLGFVPILEIEFMAKTHTYTLTQRRAAAAASTVYTFGIWQTFQLGPLYHTIPSNPPKKPHQSQGTFAISPERTYKFILGLLLFASAIWLRFFMPKVQSNF